MPGVRTGRGAEPAIKVPQTLDGSLAGVATAMTFVMALIRARAMPQPERRTAR